MEYPRLSRQYTIVLGLGYIQDKCWFIYY